MKTKKITNFDIQKLVRNNPKFKRKLAINSFYWFFTIYLSSYINYESADFQKQIFNVLQDNSINSVVITVIRHHL